MARSRRGRGSSRRRSDGVDWVVNSDTYGQAGSLGNGLQVALSLTVPKYIMDLEAGGGATPWGMHAVPEQESGQMAYRVKGHYRLTPGGWAVGNTFRVMIRIIKAPVDGPAALAVLPTNYSLFSAYFANERYLWQRYHFETFSGGNFGEVFPLDVRFRCKLEPNEGLFLVAENQTGITQTMSFEPFLRTLMRAD